MSTVKMVFRCLRVNSLAAMLKLARSPEFTKDKSVTVNSKVLIDKDRFGYWGNSLGGILGGGYVSQSPDIKRAVLGRYTAILALTNAGVPGSPMAFILSRSKDFGQWHSALTKLSFFNWRGVRMSLV